ncbi:hypothetical protein HPB48_016839 [Haemaphysalis longicornis]|uniref:Protein kinase domain-containing protein n=1 Tax=Haemaphysalis longicornis TaxID=44386 RepID=A0A9J6FSH5_HAELO|nr:hypothetical protein HPB48_016839 [Haemaphysalis longicornis]
MDDLSDEYLEPPKCKKEPCRQAYEVFHYDMRGLSFDTNYTVILRSTDSVEKETGNPATMWFKTPSCLDCYQFNFSLCASTWVAPPARGVQIAWSPPAYTSEENRVLGYQVILEEEKSVFDLDTKPAPRIRRSVGAESGETTGSLNFGSSFEFGQLRKHAFRLIRKPSDPFEIHYAELDVQESIGRDGATPEERRNLLREIELLKLVGQHPNVVSLRGYCTTGRTVALVVEYCPLGDLRAYLVRTRYAQLGREEFLSSKRVVHRDLAARNVLMMNEQLVKIADLGLSRDMYQEGVYRKQGAERLPIRWMAPESLSHMTYTTMSDVWSFGVLMWETLSLGAVPYPGIQNHQLLEYIAAGNRLDKPANCSMEAVPPGPRNTSYRK